jgi:tRNA threonylcarbamoyladenosine biosynthesis protein TsaB
MATILQIETATPVCSVAISQHGKTIQLKEEAAPNIHASSVTLFIEEVMQKAELNYSDLDAIAISKGPGSYTGLRIGVSTAKGLCFALDKPLIAVSTLKMMANGFLKDAPNYNGLICPMIDARRMEVFTAIYKQDLTVFEEVNAKIVAEQSFEDILTQQAITFIGDGAEKCMSVIAHQNAAISTSNYNSAANMSSLAFEAFQHGVFEDVAYFEPFYLKDFVFTTPKNKSI